MKMFVQVVVSVTVYVGIVFFGTFIAKHIYHIGPTGYVTIGGIAGAFSAIISRAIDDSWKEF